MNTTTSLRRNFRNDYAVCGAEKVAAVKDESRYSQNKELLPAPARRRRSFGKMDSSIKLILDRVQDGRLVVSNIGEHDIQMGAVLSKVCLKANGRAEILAEAPVSVNRLMPTRKWTRGTRDVGE